MDKVRAAMERALAEHGLSAAPRASLSESAAGDRSAMPRSMKLAEVRRLAKPPIAPAAPGAVVAPLARETSSECVPVREIPIAASTLVEQRLVAAIPGHPEREAFCMLQAVVIEHLRDKNMSTLGVTSPRSGAGKTFTAVNLAISLAKDARRNVLLVDLDLRRPSVHTTLGVVADLGVEDCLFEGVTPATALFSPSIDGLAVLPARRGSRNVDQILRSSNVAALLEALKQQRPEAIVVLDLPPIVDRGDAATFERLADALLLVVEDGATKERDYRRVMRAIDHSKHLCTVLNKIEAGSRRGERRNG
jgi:Mrp family chromosome partitioning ATPase